MMKRNFYSFKDLTVFKCLYTYLTRSHLEYACVIWESKMLSHCKQIEKLQNKM